MVPREITVAEIEKYVDEGAGLAARAKRAGFDGVEINHGTCHLGNAFLSSFWNRRQEIFLRIWVNNLLIGYVWAKMPRRQGKNCERRRR